MSKRFVVLMLALLWTGLGTRPAAAQERTVTGTVASAEDGQPLSGATVAVVGADRRTLTDPQGNFSIPVPGGTARLQVSLVGYTSQTVPVPAGQSSVTVRLGEDVLNLEGIVVTGQATSIARRNLANAVATITAEELNRTPSARLYPFG